MESSLYKERDGRKPFVKTKTKQVRMCNTREGVKEVRPCSSDAYIKNVSLFLLGLSVCILIAR